MRNKRKTIYNKILNIQKEKCSEGTNYKSKLPLTFSIVTQRKGVCVWGDNLKKNRALICLLKKKVTTPHLLLKNNPTKVYQKYFFICLLLKSTSQG